MRELLFESPNRITEDLIYVFKEHATKNGFLGSGQPLADFNTEVSIAINKALDNAYNDGMVDGLDYAVVHGIEDIEQTRRTLMDELRESRGFQA